MPGDDSAPAFGAPHLASGDGRPVPRSDAGRVLRALATIGRLPDEGSILVGPGGLVLADDQAPCADLITGPTLECGD